MVYLTLKSVPELAPLTTQKRRWVHEQCIRRFILNKPASWQGLAAYLASVFATIMMFLGGEALFGLLNIDDNLLMSLIIYMMNQVKSLSYI